jgi:ATP-dependent helicase/DNAse subunit B
MDQYNEAWKSVSGELGGFKNNEEEQLYKSRGAIMINRVMFHPGPLLNKAVKLVSPDSLPPRFYISQKDDILLCGKVDWLEYIPEDDSVHIIDFKTGVNEEKEDSLQLPIYTLLVMNCQNRKVSKISYWYLEKDNAPTEMPMPDLAKAKDTILEVALNMKKARKTKEFLCPKNGCFACKPLENILNGKAKFVGTSDYQDIYINEVLPDPNNYQKEDVMPF